MTACPQYTGNYITVIRKNLDNHIGSLKHKSSARDFQDQLSLNADISWPEHTVQSHGEFSGVLQNSVTETSPLEDDHVMISDLWTPVVREVALGHEGDKPEEDSLEECIRALAAQQILTCQFPPIRASGDSSELPDEGDENEEDYGQEDEGTA